MESQIHYNNLTRPQAYHPSGWFDSTLYSAYRYTEGTIERDPSGLI